MTHVMLSFNTAAIPLADSASSQGMGFYWLIFAGVFSFVIILIIISTIRAKKTTSRIADKMMKKLARSSVPEGETLVFFDLAQIAPASETTKQARNNLLKMYAHAYLSAFGLSGAMVRKSAASFAASQVNFQTDYYVLVVTDRQVRIINVWQPAGRFRARWLRLEGSEDVVLPLDQVKIQTGEISKGQVFGVKHDSIPVIFKLPGDNSLTLHCCYKEDNWRELEATLG